MSVDDRNGISWPEKRLGDVADEITVGWVGPMTDEYRVFGIPFLRSLNVKPYRISQKDIKYISSEFHQRISKSRLRPGDVVIVRTGDPGTAAVIPDWLADANCSDLVIVRPGGNLDPRFLAYFVNAVAHHQISAQIVGAVQQHFNVGSAKQLVVPMPALGEQRAIAKVLGALDDKIELNRRMNRTLAAMAQALFRSWFVDFDPVIAKAAAGVPYGLDETFCALFPDCFVESTIGEIPKGWTTRPVSEIVENLFDGPHATPAESQEGAIFLGIGNISENQIDLSGIRRINESDWPKWTRRVTPRSNDIVFSYEATLGNFALIPGWLRCCLGRRLALIRPRSGNSDTHFLFHYFTGKVFQDYLSARIVSGATVDRISLNDFPSYPVLTPPQPLLQAFEKQAEWTWKLIHSNIRQNLFLAETRGTLLPRLFSGETRIRHAEKVIEAIL